MKINLGEGVDLDAQLVMTGRGCVIGQSGSGKSFMMGIIAEELCKLGLPFIVIDTEGEYHNLKNSFKAIWVSNSREADVSLEINYGKLIEESITGNVPIIFDVSDTTDQLAYASNVLSAMYEIEDRLRVPYLVMAEEADKLAPQVIHSRKNIVEEISVRGRKRGIGLLIATQRPANISKNVLSQCSYGFIGKLTIENDIAAIDILLSNRQMRDSVVRLAQGEFIPFGINVEHVIKVKGRSVEHYGSTPKVVAGGQSADMSAILGRLSAPQKHSTGALQPAQPDKQLKGSRHQAEPEAVTLVKPRYSESDAAAYARGKTSHRLAGFPAIRTGETVESVERFYYPLRHIRILVPTRNSHRFKERYAFVDSNARIASMGKGLKFVSTGIKPGARATPRQEELLRQLRMHGKSSPERLGRYIGQGPSGKYIDGLIRMGIVRQAGKHLALNDMLGFASKRDIDTVEIKADAAQASAKPSISADRAVLMAKLMFPGCTVSDLGSVRIEMYKITLRKGDRLRMFVLDSISFKDRTRDMLSVAASVAASP